MNPSQAVFAASRGVRRALVLTFGAAVVLLVASALIGLPQALAVAALIVSAAVATYLDRAVGKPLRQVANLDERQRAARDRAHRIAYVTMNIAMVVACIPAVLMDGVVWPASAVRTLPLILLGLLTFLHLSLPAMILSWTEPDPVGLDAEEPLANS